MKINVLDDKDPDETKFVEVDNPPADLLDSQDDIEEVEARFKRRKIKLSDDDKKRLERELQIIIRDWVDSRSALADKLKERNDLFEGVTTISDYPWPGASNVHIPLPKIKAREIAATINRTSMRPVPFLMTEYAGPAALYEADAGFVKDLENFVEDKIKNDTNIHETIKLSIPVCIRDGTAPLQIIWETEYETVKDFKMYTDPSDFSADYKSAEAAGIDKKKYNEIIRTLTSGTPYEVEYEYEIATYDGPKAYIVNLIDFVHWPVFIPRISDCKVHGKRVWYTDYQLLNKSERGFFEKDLVEGLVSQAADQHFEDDITTDRDAIDGISRDVNLGNAKEYEFFELVYRGALTDADREKNISRKYLIYFHFLTSRIHRIESYPIRKGQKSYFPLKIIPRENRLLGMSLMDDISDLSMEIDTLHRQRINSRTITHVPSFKAKDSIKHLFDPSRRDLRFKPGVTFYVTNMDDVEQFDIKPVDLSGSVDDEMLLFQLIDMVTGSSSGLSGQSDPLDPRAPARKQSELLRQSTNRIDDYVQALLPDFQDIGQFVVDLYYQFGPNRIKYYTKSEDGAVLQNEMERAKLFNPNVTFKVQGISVFTSPEQEYQRAVELYQLLGADPLTAQVPRLRRRALERVLQAGRTQDEQSLLPSKEEVERVVNQPNPAGPTPPPVPGAAPVPPAPPPPGGPGLLPTQDQSDAAVQKSLQDQKIAAKLADSNKKMAHGVKQQFIQGAIDSQLQAEGETQDEPQAG